MIGVGLYLAIAIFVITVLIGMFLKWLIEGVGLLAEREASIASFSLSLGQSLSQLYSDDAFDYFWVMEISGSIVGLSVLWWYLFRRTAARG